MMQSAAGRGAAVGLVAGVPQVLVVQVAEKLLGLPSEKADIGPRFVERATRNLGTSVPSPVHWLLSAVFHFAYSALWGALYGLVASQVRVAPATGSLVMGGAIWTAAFSHIGGGTQSGTEPHPSRRDWREHVLHVTAALSFSVTAAYLYAWLAELTGESDRSARAAVPVEAAGRPFAATTPSASAARQEW